MENETQNAHNPASEIMEEKETQKKRICLVGSLAEDEKVKDAAETFKVPVVHSETGLELLTDTKWLTYFVLNEFEGQIYEAISKSKHKIFGPPALIYCSQNDGELPNHNRPVHNYSMKGVVAAFSGVRKRDELTELVHLIHFMGGSIRKEMNHRATHLICPQAFGDKYRYALTFRLNVVRPSWVREAWSHRYEENFSARNEKFAIDHKLKIFENCRVVFIGFPEHERVNMANLLRSYNGIETTSDDETCTHKVVDDEHAGKNVVEDSKFFVLKAEWFWTRIAEGYAPEDDFLFKDYMKSIKDEHSERRDSLINSSSKVQRKRKRLSRVVLEGTPGSAGKRKSSTSDAGILSDSLIDYTASPDKSADIGKLNENGSTERESCKKFSMRRNHFMDFYHTESNYVGILETIMNLFKNPLEKMADENPDQADLLNKSELKSIFGNFLPIYEIHKKMLTRLQQINSNWSEECLIGEIILENRDRLLKAYPPYINFFEQMKATVIQCTQNKPRFQAFLKINQSKPECGRQTLQELMIRPVQRLPSISLLLNDILKHTPKSNADNASLVEALTSIKEVMTYINEDKRRTESQKQMFDIFNDIDNCPPMLVSSHRSFISKCEVVELETSDVLSGRGDHLILFLFSDTLEVCKKRSKVNNPKSPSNNPYTAKHTGPKPYKHIKLIPLNSIRTVADITDSMRAFALSYRSNANVHDPSKDKLCAFNIADEEIDKTMYVKNFCKQMAENACKTDSSEFRVAVTSDEINIDTSDVNLGTLSKAFRLATRTRLKVGRAFSFKTAAATTTPSRKRNVPLSPFGSNISLTPSTISSMHHLKLQSSLTLNELDNMVVKVPLSDHQNRNQNAMDCEES